MSFQQDKRIRIISGHYGVGKSEFASNYAVKLFKSNSHRDKIAIVDLDIVNPYFTTRGIKDILRKNGIEIIGPSSEATNADLPAIPREVESVFYDESYDVIIDLGGDAAGSKVLGRFSQSLTNQGYDFYYLVNVNRPFSEDFDGVYSFLIDIQNATRLKVTHIVNSTHLLYETTIEQIEKGEKICRQLADKLSLNYKYVVIPKWIIDKKIIDKNINSNDYDANQSNIKLIQNKFSAEEIFELDITLRPVWLTDEFTN